MQSLMPTRAERNSQLSHSFSSFLAAVEDEHKRFNRAIEEGAVAVIRTAFGSYRVTTVTEDWWYRAYRIGRTNAGESPQEVVTWRAFKGANNAVWADLLHQAEVERSPHLASSSRPTSQSAA
ncbi:MAG TPA: hypothetical protein VHL09_10880 [Dehalococcoidia bacterium]|nr:hypothetical protein [Dehalococcoidia bacterium]